MKLICDAPVDFVAQLLGSWLTLKDLCKLDSAVSSAENRLSLGAIYEAVSVVGRLVMNESDVEKQLDWFLVRKIRLSTLRNDYRLPRNTFSKVTALLKHSGNQLRNLFLTDNDALMIAVAVTIVRYCTKLEVLTVKEMAVNVQFFSMCGSLHGLKELNFFECENINADDMQCILCPSLRTLVLNGDISVELQKIFLNMYPNLLNYSLSFAEEVELEGLPETLESVHVYGCNSIRVINLNKSLKKLLISCTNSTDDDIVEIFSSCSSLQVLSLPNNWRITDATIIRVGNTFGKSLTSLDLYECEAITENGLQYVCEKCKNLVHLAVGGCGDSDPSFITTALDCLPSLHSLDISESVATDALLARVAHPCIEW